MKVLRKLTSIVCAAALALGGCEKNPLRKCWTEKDLQEDYSPTIRTIDPEYMLQEEMYPKDLDGDGKVDVLYTLKEAHFLAEGYEKLAKEKGFFVTTKTKKMNAEMVDKATQAIEAQRGFQREYLKSQGLYKQ